MNTFFVLSRLGVAHDSRPLARVLVRALALVALLAVPWPQSRRPRLRRRAT